MQRKNLLIPPESEPTPFATNFNMSRMQSPMIWDVGLRGAEGRIFLNKEHQQEARTKRWQLPSEAWIT